MKAVIAWVVLMLVEIHTPGSKFYYAAAKETKEEAEVRYESISSDLIAVVYDENELPVYAGPYGRAKTMALMLGIIMHESKLRKDVDFQLGAQFGGDDGASVCLMQVRVGNGKTVEGWTKTDLLDRKKCFRAALHRIHESFQYCRYLGDDYRLSAYTSGLDAVTGKCKESSASKIRINSGKALYKAYPPILTDKEVMGLIPKTGS